MDILSFIPILYLRVFEDQEQRALLLQFYEILDYRGITDAAGTTNNHSNSH